MLIPWPKRHKILHYTVLPSNVAAESVQDDTVRPAVCEMWSPCATQCPPATLAIVPVTSGVRLAVRRRYNTLPAPCITFSDRRLS